MKLPNGYGSVVHLKGKRRNPYCVRKTIGWTDMGYPKYFVVGYTKSRKEGLELLAKYNADPWDNSKDLTLKELHDKWISDRASLLGDKNRQSLKYTYKHIESLENMKYKDIKAYMMQKTINECGRSYSTQSAIRNLWKHLDSYAYEIDIIDKKYSDLITAKPVELSDRKPFSEEELRQLWRFYYEGLANIDMVLIFIYTGFRIGEMQRIRVENIDFDEWIITGGMKTAAGKNRKVPIHSAIKSLVWNRAKINRHGYLFEDINGMYADNYMRQVFNQTLKSINMNHIPHECRHTFESMLDDAGANRKCIDMMMGHVSKDVGNRVYNHKTIEDLKENIELIKGPKELGVSNTLVTKEP